MTRKIKKDELEHIRQAVKENQYLLDGVDVPTREQEGEDTIANKKTYLFVEKYGTDAADELIEFIVANPEYCEFSPAKSRVEEDAWILKRNSYKYNSLCYLKIFRLYSNTRRTMVVHD